MQHFGIYYAVNFFDFRERENDKKWLCFLGFYILADDLSFS